MLKWFQKKKKDNKGFSLVELIIVVAIMAILVGLVAPQYLKYVEKSRKSADASNLDEMVKAVQVYAADSDTNMTAGTYTITISTDVDVATTPTATSGNTSDIDKAISNSVSNFKKTRLKSNKWTTTTSNNDTSNVNSIEAEIEIKQDGSTVVKYSPASVATFVNKTAK